MLALTGWERRPTKCHAKNEPREKKWAVRAGREWPESFPRDLSQLDTLICHNFLALVFCSHTRKGVSRII